MSDKKEMSVGMWVTWHDKTAGYTMKQFEERENGVKFGVISRIQGNDISVTIKESGAKYSFLPGDLDILDANTEYFLSHQN